MQAEDFHIRITPAAVQDHGVQVLPFPDGEGCDGLLIHSVTPEIVDDDVEPVIQVDGSIFQGTVAVVRESVGDQDITVCGFGIRQELGMQDVSVAAGDGVVHFFHIVIPGQVIVMLLPGPGILQGMVMHVFHRVDNKINADSQHQNQQNQQNQQRDSHVNHYSFPPVRFPLYDMTGVKSIVFR